MSHNTDILILFYIKEFDDHWRTFSLPSYSIISFFCVKIFIPKFPRCDSFLKTLFLAYKWKSYFAKSEWRCIFACYASRRNPTRLVACISRIRCPRIELPYMYTGNLSPSWPWDAMQSVDRRRGGRKIRDSKEHPVSICPSIHL